MTDISTLSWQGIIVTIIIGAFMLWFITFYRQEKEKDEIINVEDCSNETRNKR